MFAAPDPADVGRTSLKAAPISPVTNTFGMRSDLPIRIFLRKHSSIRAYSNVINIETLLRIPDHRRYRG